MQYPDNFCSAKYSREIQNSLESQDGKDIERWHIPAADRRAWLCLTTGSSTLSSNSSTVPKSSFTSHLPLGESNVTKSTDAITPSIKTNIERSDNEDIHIHKIPKKSIEIINDDINENDVKFGVQKTQFIAQERRKLY